MFNLFDEVAAYLNGGELFAKGGRLKFKNGDLANDAEKLLSYDEKPKVKKEYDKYASEEQPYRLLVGDEGYFYGSKNERDADYDAVKTMFAKKFAKGGELSAEQAEKRLEELRAALEAENISYGELAELQSLAKFIKPDDVQLLEAAGVPEFPDGDEEKNYDHIKLEDVIKHLESDKQAYGEFMDDMIKKSGSVEQFFKDNPEELKSWQAWFGGDSMKSFEKGGRFKRSTAAINRDRKYISQEEHEKNYKRKTKGERYDV